MQRNMPGRRSTIATEMLPGVIAMVNKKNASHAIRQLSAQGWLSFSEIAMWGDKPLRLRLSMKAIADGSTGGKAVLLTCRI